MLKKYTLAIAFLFSLLIVFAGQVDTVLVHSNSMNKDIKAVVITPDNYRKTDKLPVIYLLHGWSDNYSTWIKKVPHITQDADRYNFIIVMPDGNYNSWYWDSPVDTNSKYETFVSNELIKYIDSNYKTINDRKGRAIAGNSMGGQGALFLAFRHQDKYGAVGSLSGGVDIRSFPLEWGMADKLGSFADNPKVWNDYAIVNNIYRLVPDKLKIIIDCGLNDFFYLANQKLHKKLKDRNISHTFMERPGRHNWEYWSMSISYQFIFFNDFFNNIK